MLEVTQVSLRLTSHSMLQYYGHDSHESLCNKLFWTCALLVRRLRATMLLEAALMQRYFFDKFSCCVLVSWHAWLVGWLAGWLAGLVGWLAGWRVDGWMGWLVGWLPGWRVGGWVDGLVVGGLVGRPVGRLAGRACVGNFSCLSFSTLLQAGMSL